MKLLKKQFLLLFLLVACSYCRAQQNQVSSSSSVILNGKKIIIKDVKTKYLNTKSFSSSIGTLKPYPLKKVKGILKLKLLNGRYLTLKDITSSESEEVKHKLKGLLLERFYVVLVNYYDSGEYWLIDKNSGVKTVLWGEPYLSPNNSHIATFSGSLDYDIMPNGIQLFNLTVDGVSVEWEYKIKDWEPSTMMWKDNHSLVIQKVIPDYMSPTKRAITSFIELTF